MIILDDKEVKLKSLQGKQARVLWRHQQGRMQIKPQKWQVSSLSKFHKVYHTVLQFTWVRYLLKLAECCEDAHFI